MGWNYRMAAKNFSYKETFPDNEKMHEFPDIKIFSIIEVFYDKNGNPNGYADEVNALSGWESLEDLIGTMDLVNLAKQKPIIDLDDFPNIWEDKNNIKDKNDE